MITSDLLMEGFLFSMIGIPGIVLLVVSFTSDRFFQRRQWTKWDEDYAYTRIGWFMVAISTLLTIGVRLGGTFGARAIVAIFGVLSIAGGVIVVAAFRAA